MMTIYIETNLSFLKVCFWAIRNQFFGALLLKGNPVDLKNYQVMWKNLDTTLRKFTFTEKAIVATEFITVLERVFNTPIPSLTLTNAELKIGHTF